MASNLILTTGADLKNHSPTKESERSEKFVIVKDLFLLHCDKTKTCTDTSEIGNTQFERVRFVLDMEERRKKKSKR